MSGIVCVYSESGVAQDAPRYLSALRRLIHRGPDGEGSLLRQNLFLGVRSSSVGPGAMGEQPLVGADGKIIVGGNFTNINGVSRNCIARLNSDGTLDTTFNPGASGYVYSLAVQTAGKILVAGRFSTLGGASRSCIGRLNNTTAATQSLTCEGSTITWLRGGNDVDAGRSGGVPLKRPIPSAGGVPHRACWTRRWGTVWSEEGDILDPLGDTGEECPPPGAESL